MAKEQVKKDEPTLTATPTTQRTFARVVHIHSGLDLIGSVTSINHKQGEIEVYDWGVRLISKKSGRIVRIYNANIKGLEELK